VIHGVSTILIVVASIVLMLARPRNVPEGYWVGAGALLLVLLHLMPARDAGKAVLAGGDVYLFLIGMMVLAELARSQGVFDWLASAAVRHARGSGTRLFLLLYCIGILVTTCMSNDATAVVLTPAVAAAVKHAGAKTRPHLFACALIANAASFVLPISNPANLVLYRDHMPSLGRWLALYTLPSVLSIVMTFVVLRLWFRTMIAAPIKATSEVVALSRGGRLVTFGMLVVVGVLALASLRRWDLGLPTTVASVSVALVVCIVARANPLRLLRAVSWTTLLLVAGLFVLVEATKPLGSLQAMQSALRWASDVPRNAGMSVVAFTLASANNVFNNLPVGLLTGATLQAAHEHGLLASAAVLGVDLGPNLAVTGSLATVLWLIALRKEGENVSFLDFSKVGVIAMPVALAAALIGLRIAGFCLHLS
jgi:arsenical pump membrane protein